MSTPLERKNQLVWDQMDAGQYKQALQLCNRRIKKGEKSEMLLTLKAFVLTHIHTSAATAEAEELASTLCEREPPIVASDVLRLLSRVLSNFPTSKSAEINKLWERASKQAPQDESLAREWFWATVRAMDWRGAQKAAMSLQKTFTKRREYWFWAIVASLLLHNSLPKESPERKLFGTLAYRMLDKARNDTPADTTVIPPRAIQTSQEVNLLLELLSYVAPNDPERESLEVLNSENLGVDSAVGSGDWWGLTRKKLALLAKTKDWKSLYDTCQALLPKGPTTEHSENTEKPMAGRGDDWLVWHSFVEAAGNLYDQGDKGVSKEALATILEHRKTAPPGSSRNGILALVKFASLFHDKNDGPEGTPTLLEAIQEYYATVSVKSCCFEDLQKYLEMLEEIEQSDFLKFVAKHIFTLPEEPQKAKIDRTIAIINQQKFVYLLTISPIQSVSPKDDKALTSFVETNLKIYVSSLPLGEELLITDNQYGDDAGLMAVMGLVRLYSLKNKDQTPLYQAIIILDTLLRKSKHNYQALLILVRVFVLVGAVKLALEVYPRLNIKQIQNDTLSHYLLTRITTLLPSDPRVSVQLSDAGNIYNSNNRQTPNMLQLGFEKGSYAQMMSFIEFSERVSGSVCRSMWEVELRRLVRLANFPDLDSVSEVGHNGRVWDNRDFGVMMDCELSSVQPFESTFRVGPLPHKRWVRAFAAAEGILDCIGQEPQVKETNGVQTNGAPPSSSFSAEKPQRAAETIRESLEADAAAADNDKEFTQAERAYLKLAIQIAELAIATSAKDGQAVTEKLESIASVALPDITTSIPITQDWSLLHHLGMAKDALVSAELLFKHLTSLKGIKPKLATTPLKDAITKSRGIVKGAADKAKAALGDEDKIQELVDGVLDEEDGAVGKVFRKEEGVFGGVEKVADEVRRVRTSVVESFEHA